MNGGDSGGPIVGNSMPSEPYTVLALTLPESYFPDGDDICREAGLHIAAQLGKHLENHGHSIPEWVRGGCAEDCWVYLESQYGSVTYEYAIMFFARAALRDDNCSWMAIQYGTKVAFWRRFLSGRPKLAVDDTIHETLRGFGTIHEQFEFLTEAQYHREC